MKREGDELRLAATDLTTFSACQHATMQNLAVVKGERKKPPIYPDPSAELLRQRGDAHEAAYLAKLKETHAVVEIERHAPDAVERTLEAMRAGAEVIYQGRLRIGSRWLGVPDFLRRVEVPSPTLGVWSYEPWDAKLAREPKASALLQLCFYAELLEHVQGVLPQRMSLVLGDMRVEEFATARYGGLLPLPEEVLRGRRSPARRRRIPSQSPLCDVCDYARRVRRAPPRGRPSVPRRRAHGKPATRAGRRVGAHACASWRRYRWCSRRLPWRTSARPRSRASGSRRASRSRGATPGPCATSCCPTWSRDTGCRCSRRRRPAILFIDFEGDPYVLDGGLEYLLGVVELPGTYTGHWAFDRTSERAAFERLIAFIGDRRERYPDMHVYHYNHYETTALKRLAGRFATCVDELDALLRGRVFVDLYRAVRQGVRASVESYSLKKIEPLFGYTREVALRDANRCLAAFEGWMAVRDAGGPPDEVRVSIEGYNRDDCLSALRLRDWLEEQRMCSSNRASRSHVPSRARRNRAKRSPRARSGPSVRERSAGRRARGPGGTLRTSRTSVTSSRTFSSGTGARTSRSGGSTSSTAT